MMRLLALIFFALSLRLQANRVRSVQTSVRTSDDAAFGTPHEPYIPVFGTGFWKEKLFGKPPKPSYRYLGQVDVENLDVTVMIDTSHHMANTIEPQTKMVLNLVRQLKSSVDNVGTDTMHEISEQYPDSNTIRQGGDMRVAVGTFNDQDTSILAGLTSDIDAVGNGLRALSVNDYRSSASLLPAVEGCRGTMKDEQSSTQRLCIIIADNEISCQPHVLSASDPEVEKMCQQWPELCPNARATHENHKEYERNKECAKTIASLVKDDSIQYMFALRVNSKKDEQSRLSDEYFREVVTALTGCHFDMTPDLQFFRAEDSPACTQFLVLHDFGDETATTIDEVAKHLRVEAQVASEPI